MRLNRIAICALPIVMVLSLACDKTGGETPPVNSQSAPIALASPATSPSASSPGRPRADRGPRRGGGGGMVAMMLNATRDLELKEAQKTTIDGLQDEARKHDESSKTDFKEYRALIAAGVKEGKIDTAKLAPLKANMDKAMQARKDKDAETLNALYGALEPAQRKALVASIRSKEAERKARGEARKGEDSKPAEADWKKRRTEHLTKELELDATQQKSIEALFAKGEHPSPASMDTMREEMKKRTDALYTAFEAEGFDAKKLDLWPAPPKKMGEASDKQVQALSQLIAILKPEQRQKLAARMSEGPGSRRFGYPVDDESGVGYFFDGPHQREEPAPPKP